MTHYMQHFFGEISINHAKFTYSLTWDSPNLALMYKIVDILPTQYLKLLLGLLIHTIFVACKFYDKHEMHWDN